jgi:flagellar basal-body rod protein FlgF
MADGIYVAASGMMAKLTELDIVANNMANANTPGFKRDMVTFDEVLADESLRTDQQDLHYVEIGKSRPNMDDGALKVTGNPLDFALRGDGFFRIETANGERLTRSGQFRISQKGDRVLDNGGVPIQIPPGGNPEVQEDGSIMIDGDVVGQLGRVKVSSPEDLRKEGATLYRVDPADILPGDDIKVMQGFVEESNANSIGIMVELIGVQRSYEALQKAMNAYRDMDNRSIRIAR